MVKAELVAQLAQEKGLKMTVAQRAVDTLFGAMSMALAKGRGIEIRGFASFKVRTYKGYQGRNPRTGSRAYAAKSRTPTGDEASLKLALPSPTRV